MGHAFSGRAFDELNYKTFDCMVKCAKRGSFTEFARVYVLETSIPAAVMKVQEHVGSSGSVESVAVAGDIEYYESVVGYQVKNPDEEGPYVLGQSKV